MSRTIKLLDKTFEVPYEVGDWVQLHYREWFEDAGNSSCDQLVTGWSPAMVVGVVLPVHGSGGGISVVAIGNTHVVAGRGVGDRYIDRVQTVPPDRLRPMPAVEQLAMLA